MGSKTFLLLLLTDAQCSCCPAVTNVMWCKKERKLPRHKVFWEASVVNAEKARGG